MDQADSASRSLKKQAGFTLTELMIASSAFVVILTGAVSMLVSWNRVNSQTEADLNATYTATMALRQMAEDVRVSTYLFHYATISINDMQTKPVLTYPNTGKSNPFLEIKGLHEIKLSFPPVTEGTTLDGVPDYTVFFGNTHKVDYSLCGVTSQGSLPMLAMISDQPSGIQHPRYIVYWEGTSSTRLSTRTGFAGDYYSVPLYRLEASPSSSGRDDTPKSWYTSRDTIATSSATSSLTFTLNNANASSSLVCGGTTTDIKYRLAKIADVIVGTGLSHPFTLRNPHPYSNLSLISPYLATMSIRTSRASGPGGLRNDHDIYQMDTSAYARNVPLPSLSSN